MYKIVRFFQNSTKYGLFTDGQPLFDVATLEQAQAHCKNPDTSSATSTSPEGLARTDIYGPWFDGYTERK